MGSTWAVTTERLESSAAKIDEAVEKYNKEWAKIYEEIQSLRNISWEGEASNAFNTKLEGYRPNFEKMATVLTNYTQMLKDSAKKYKDVERRLTEAQQ